MKDLKIQNVHPVADPKVAEKAGRKGKAAPAQSFDDTLSDSLNSTVARLNDLNDQIQQEPTGKVAKADQGSMKEAIHAAKENFDQMMLQKRNLAQLYQRLTNKDDS